MTTPDTRDPALGLVELLDQRRAMIGNLNHLCLTQTEALLWCDTLIAAERRRQAEAQLKAIDFDMAAGIHHKWDARMAAVEEGIAAVQAANESLDRLTAHLAGASGEGRL